MRNQNGAAAENRRKAFLRVVTQTAGAVSGSVDSHSGDKNLDLLDAGSSPSVPFRSFCRPLLNIDVVAGGTFHSS